MKLELKKISRSVLLLGVLFSALAQAKIINIQCEINASGDAAFRGQFEASGTLQSDDQGNLTGQLVYSTRLPGKNSQTGASQTVQVTGTTEIIPAGELYRDQVEIIQIKGASGSDVASFGMTLGSKAQLSSRVLVNSSAEFYSTCHE